MEVEVINTWNLTGLEYTLIELSSVNMVTNGNLLQSKKSSIWSISKVPSAKPDKFSILYLDKFKQNFKDCPSPEFQGLSKPPKAIQILSAIKNKPAQDVIPCLTK